MSPSDPTRRAPESRARLTYEGPVATALTALGPGTEPAVPDTMLRMPGEDRSLHSLDYLFKLDGDADLDRRRKLFQSASALTEEFAAHGIRRAVIPIALEEAEEYLPVLTDTEIEVFVALRPGDKIGSRELRELQRLHHDFPAVVACSITPCLRLPQVPINHREYYPLYSKCEELGLTLMVNVGVPGPRVPAACQQPMLLDDVCWFFPDLRIVMKHGGEPWVEECVKLMLRWPNLFYTPSAFKPKRYPREIIEFANSRGSKQVLFSDYFPLFSHEETFQQLTHVPFGAHVWEPFLWSNFERAFDLSRQDSTQ